MKLMGRPTQLVSGSPFCITQILFTMKKVILSLVTLLAATTLATAQMRPSVKLEAGANCSQQVLKFDKLPTNVDMLMGYRVGVGVELDIKNGFYFNPGLYFLSRGFKRVDVVETEISRDVSATITTTNTLWLHNVEVPLHVGYRVPISSDITLSLQAGPWLAYGMAGKLTTRVDVDAPSSQRSEPSKEATEKTIEPYDTKSKSLKPFDLGLGVQGAFEYRQFALNLGFERSLLNTCFREMGEVYNMNLYVGLGYRF